jgi:hypothetical protein
MKDHNVEIEMLENKEIEKSIPIGDIMVLLLKADDTLMPEQARIENLIALSSEQKLLWKAELPEDQPYYTEVKYINNKLFAWCGSMMYEIDRNTGKILSSELVK